ncbi:MAG: hypothetical protein ACFFBP_01945 [Promethearchaeota archaeon]
MEQMIKILLEKGYFKANVNPDFPFTRIQVTNEGVAIEFPQANTEMKYGCFGSGFIWIDLSKERITYYYSACSPYEERKSISKKELIDLLNNLPEYVSLNTTKQ